MPKSNPYGKIGKKIESIRSKLSKLSAELNSLALQVAAAAKKSDAAPAVKKPVKRSAKKAGAKKAVARKPRARKPGRPAKQ
jgi:septal ring factor EnvC (AmiA/AmiB activator)